MGHTVWVYGLWMLVNHHAIFASHHLPSLHHVTASHRVPLINPDSDNSSWDIKSEPGHQDTEVFRDIAAISQAFKDKMTEHMITGEICVEDYCKTWYVYMQWHLLFAKFQINTAQQKCNFKHVEIIGHCVISFEKWLKISLMQQCKYFQHKTMA